MNTQVKDHKPQARPSESPTCQEIVAVRETDRTATRAGKVDREEWIPTISSLRLFLGLCSANPSSYQQVRASDLKTGPPRRLPSPFGQIQKTS